MSIAVNSFIEKHSLFFFVVKSVLSLAMDLVMEDVQLVLIGYGEKK